MPHPALNKLETTSQDSQVQAAVSECIAAEVRAGVPQEQAVAMCMEMVKTQMGENNG